MELCISRCCDAGEHSKEGYLLGRVHSKAGVNAVFNEETKQNYK